MDRVLRLSDEQTGDLAMYCMIAILFAVLVVLTVRRTWRWDALGRALTAVCCGIVIAYGLAAHRLIWPDEQPAEIRWFARVVIIVSAVAAIIALIRDKPTG